MNIPTTTSLMFQFKPFQKEDLARAACVNSAILAWEPGMGKTLAIFAWPLLKQAKRVLIVAPESLHLQIRMTGREFFGVTVRPLPDQDAFARWKLGKPAKAGDSTRFYITSYHQLGLNGGDEWTNDTPSKQVRDRRMLAGIAPKHWTGIGLEADGIRCVGIPTLSTLCLDADAFDAVVIDEGTRIQGDDSLLAAGVRRLNPALRLVLSATPIKNKLGSLFWLADWVAQGRGAEEVAGLWPYESSESGKRAFAKAHLEREKNVTKAKEAGKKPSWRQTPRVTNQHDLWRLLAPLVIRRRKTDCGEQIVAKNVRPVWCPPGAAQIKSYVLAALNPPSVTKAGTAPSPMSQAVMQLNTLRQICLCPDSPNLGGLRTSAYTPKMAAIVGLVDECRARGEQVVIGSTYQHFGSSVTALLRRRGLRVVMLDGRTDGAKRAEMSLAFKKGEFDVMVAGLSSMGEGHSWECCPNLILPSLEWAYDLNEQFINRVWRINSPKPANIYPVLIRGTVDEKLFDLFIEKDNASHLSLDGEFLDQPQDDADFEDFVASLANGLSLAGVDEAGIEVALAG